MQNAECRKQRAESRQKAEGRSLAASGPPCSRLYLTTSSRIIGAAGQLEPETGEFVSHTITTFYEFSLYRAKDAGEREYYGTTSYNVTRREIGKDGNLFDHIPIARRFFGTSKQGVV